MDLFSERYRKILKCITFIFVLLIAVSIFVPVCWVILASFKGKSEFYGSPWVLPEHWRFTNFMNAFNQANMGKYFLNSIIVTILALVMNLLMSIPFSYVISRFKFKIQPLLNIFLMAGLFINVNYIVVPIFLMLVDGDKMARDVLGQGFFINNIFVLALVYASTTLPFTIYLLSGYLKTISSTYEEAASIDGASNFKVMTKIIVPMAKPAVITVLLFNFLFYWNDYIISLTLMPGENRTLQVGLLNLMKGDKMAADYGRLYAGMVIVIVPALLLYAIAQKYMLEGMAQGGSKE